jgi:hypothetical protein
MDSCSSRRVPIKFAFSASAVEGLALAPPQGIGQLFIDPIDLIAEGVEVRRGLLLCFFSVI